VAANGHAFEEHGGFRRATNYMVLAARSQGGGRRTGGPSRSWPAGREIPGLFPAAAQAAVPALPTVSPAAGGAVSTTGPPSVMATVCSKWALGSPSTVDWVQ